MSFNPKKLVRNPVSPRVPLATWQSLGFLFLSMVTVGTDMVDPGMKSQNFEVVGKKTLRPDAQHFQKNPVDSMKVNKVPSI